MAWRTQCLGTFRLLANSKRTSTLKFAKPDGVGGFGWAGTLVGHRVLIVVGSPPRSRQMAVLPDRLEQWFNPVTSRRYPGQACHWDVAAAAFRPVRPSGRGGEISKAYNGHGHCTIKQSVSFSPAGWLEACRSDRGLTFTWLASRVACAGGSLIHARAGPASKPRNIRYWLNKCFSTMWQLFPRGLLMSRFTNG